MDFGASNRCKRFDLRRIALLLAAVTVTACGSPWYTSDPIEAWVVDAETGAPIEGAVVTANWQLVAPSLDTGGRKLRQLEVMETKTDKNGRFYFPGFTKINFTLDELRDEDPQILIFKSGYRYGRVSSNYSADFDATSHHRAIAISARKIALQRTNADPKVVALGLGSMMSSLENVERSGDIRKVVGLVRSLACERLRLKKLDATVILSVPGESGGIHCE